MTDIRITITAVRDPAEPFIQLIEPTDIALVRSVLAIVNPDVTESRLDSSALSLTSGGLSMARASGSIGATMEERGVTVAVAVAPRLKPLLAPGTGVSYCGREVCTIVSQHYATFEYTVRSDDGRSFCSETEFFTALIDG